MRKGTKFALVFYEAARDEIVTRIELRDKAIFLYITIMGAYLAFVFNQNFKEPIILPGTVSILNAKENLEYDLLINFPIPAISLITFYVITKHHIAIRYLSFYISYEMYKQSKRFSLPDKVRMWDNSFARAVYVPKFQGLRLGTQLAIIVFPIVYFWVFVLLNCSKLVDNYVGVILVVAKAAIDIIVVVYLTRLYREAKSTTFRKIRVEVVSLLSGRIARKTARRAPSKRRQESLSWTFRSPRR